MGKLLFIIIILFAVFYVGKQIYKFGKADGAETKPDKPDNDTKRKSLDERIDELKIEIRALEVELPKDIEKHEQSIAEAKAELERVIKMRKKLDN